MSRQTEPEGPVLPGPSATGSVCADAHPDPAVVGRPLPSHLADSAGQPWAGRHFEENAHTDDDGSAPAAYIAAITAFRDGSGSEAAVVDAMRSSRFLIPLVAHLGEEGESDSGLRIDKKQELSIVSVAGPDGRDVLPVFSSVDSMKRWNAEARPVPADGRRVALAAAGEQTELVVIDPVSTTEFAVRRPALWAVARDAAWRPSHSDPLVLASVRASIAHEPAVTDARLEPGDATATLRGPELRVRLAVRDGLSRDDLAALVERLSAGWAADPAFAERVDSVGVKVDRSPS